MATCHCEKH